MDGSPPRAGWWWVSHCSAGKGVCARRLGRSVYLLLKDGDRWGLGALILALVGVVQRLGCHLCTAESGLAPPAWADAQAEPCPKESSRSPPPHRSGGRGRGGLEGRPLGTRAGLPAAERHRSPGSQDLSGSSESDPAGAGTRAAWSPEEASPILVWSRRPQLRQEVTVRLGLPKGRG